MLRFFGASMGNYADVRASARVWHPRNLKMGDRSLIGPRVICYNQAPVTLGDFVLISQGAHVCTGTHDIEDPLFQLVARPIRIGSHAWVAADAFVGPGVTIGEGAVVGARAVVMRDVDPWQICVGNPARALDRARGRAILRRLNASKDKRE